jgi:hypothetical protein
VAGAPDKDEEEDEEACKRDGVNGASPADEGTGEASAPQRDLRTRSPDAEEDAAEDEDATEDGEEDAKVEADEEEGDEEYADGRAEEDDDEEDEEKAC